MSEYNQNALYYHDQVVILDTTNAGSTTGGLVVKGGISGKDTYITGHIAVNNVKITPNKNDIIFEQQAILNRTESFTDITDFYFDDSFANSFKAIINVTVSGGVSKYALWEINGVYKPSGWVITSTFSGDQSGVNFKIVNSSGRGQIQYTNLNVDGTTTTVRYRATTTAPPGSTPLGDGSGLINNTSGPYIANRLLYSNSTDTIANTDLVYASNVFTVGGTSRILAQSADSFTNFSNGGAITSMGDASIAKKVIVGEKIGIVTTSPQFHLDVTGDINFTGNFYKNGSLYSGSSIWDTNANNEIFTTQNLGIGTSDPTYKLDVSGGIRVTDAITAGALYVTNEVATNISSSTLNLSTGLSSGSAKITDIINTNASIGTLNATALTATNISSATLNLSTGLTSESAQVTNANVTTATVATLLTTNAVSTNISSATLNLSTGLTSASAQVTNANVTTATVPTLLTTNAVSTNISSATLNLSTGLTAASAQVTNVNVTTATVATLLTTNAVSTNISSATLNLSTGLTAASAQVTNANVTTATVPTLLTTNAVSTNVSSATLNLSTGLTAASAQVTNANVTTATVATLLTTNAVSTNISSGSIVASGSINANTLTNAGFDFTLGNGDQIGRGNSGQSRALVKYEGNSLIMNFNNDFSGGTNVFGKLTVNNGFNLSGPSDFNVTGTGRITTSLTTGALYSTNLTSTNIVGTNVSSGTLNLSTGLTSASAQVTNANVTTATVATLINTNAVSTNISGGTISAITFTGGNLSLSGNLNVAGTLTTVNITSTNLINTNVSAGFVMATNMSSGTLNLSTGLTSATANVTTATVTNLVNTNFVTTNISSATLSISTGFTTSSMKLTDNGFIDIDQGSDSRLAFIKKSGGGPSIAISNNAPLLFQVANSSNASAVTTNTYSTIMTLRTTGSLEVSNISSSTLNLSSGLTSASAQITNATIGTARVTTNLSATGNSNTVGNIFTTGGNVGIGTTSPSGKLHIKDTGSVTLLLEADSDNVNESDVATLQFSQDGGLLGMNIGLDALNSNYIKYNAGSLKDTMFHIYNDTTTVLTLNSAGNVGIGTSVPYVALEVNNVIAARGGGAGARPYFAVDDGVSAGWSFGMETDKSFRIKGGEGGGNNFVGAAANRLTVTSNGNVGIGTTSPASKLHLSMGNTYGNILFEPGSTSDGGNFGWSAINFNGYHNSGEQIINTSKTRWRILNDQRTTSDNMMIDNWNGTTLTTLMSFTTTGNVGIGIASPTTKLEVNGTAKMGTSTIGALRVNNSSSYTLSYGYLNNAGGVGFASGTNVYSIYAEARVAASEVNVYSDVRIKKNIEDINDGSALTTLRQIQPKKYSYIDTITKTTTPVWGFLAQQVDSVLDYSVNKINEYVPNIYSKANVTENTGGSILTLQSGNTNVLDSTKSEDGKIKIKIHIDNEEIPYIETDVKAIISSTQLQIEYSLSSSVTEVFVYGQKVNDFHTLNKDAIFTVSVAALQEVDRELQALKTFIQSKFPGEYP